MTRPLYERYDPVTLRNTEVEVDGNEMLFTHSQDTKPVVESCKQLASNFDPLMRRDTVHVARIPLVVWRQLQRLGITSDEKALNRWLNDRDNAVFRCDDRRTLAMALATTEHRADAPRQHETPNVVQQGAMPTPPAARAADPALAEGIDPVLLHRLYPEADSIEDAASMALAQGQKTKEAGEKLIAAQQEPVTQS